MIAYVIKKGNKYYCCAGCYGKLNGAMIYPYKKSVLLSLLKGERVVSVNIKENK